MQDVIGFAGYPRCGHDNKPFWRNYKDNQQSTQEFVRVDTPTLLDNFGWIAGLSFSNKSFY